jgi:hypothetical protein
MIKIARGLIPVGLIDYTRRRVLETIRTIEGADLTLFRQQGGISATKIDLEMLVPALEAQAELILGTKAKVDLAKSSARLQGNDTRGITWHQDYIAMGGPNVKGLTFWVPLHDLGNCPRLQFIEGIDVALTHTTDESGFAVLDRAIPEGIEQTPDVKVGDVIAFTPLELHRTLVLPEHIAPRLSLDVRAIV